MVAKAINDAQSPYVSTGPNSNSAIATALTYCGLIDLLSPDAIGHEYRVSFVPSPY
jgi:hypothetical protein